MYINRKAPAEAIIMAVSDDTLAARRRRTRTPDW